MLKDYTAYATMLLQLLAIAGVSYLIIICTKDCINHCRVYDKQMAMGRYK